MTWHIVSDSSCDLHTLAEASDDITFATIPFIVRIGETEYIDDSTMNVNEMLTRNESAAEAGQTSCPSPNAWLEEFRAPGPVLAFTISKGLSGSYNSAVAAREMLLETEPDKKIAIIDTRSTGPELVMLMRYACELIRRGETIEQIEAELNRMAEKTHIAFALISYRNLIKAGRVNRLVGVIAGHLGIWGMGIGDDNGKIAMRGKARGIKGMIKLLGDEIRARGVANGKVLINHTLNPDAAEALKEYLLNMMPDIKVEIMPTRGLDSFYAERKGLIVAF